MISYWVALIAGFLYVALGILVIIYKFFIVPLEPNMAYPLGGLLVLYGIFRIIRGIYRIKELRDEENNTDL